MSFVKSLFSSSDRGADSLIFGGLIGLLTFCFLFGWVVIAQHKEFSPLEFAGGIATILAAISGAKTARDRWSPIGDPAGQLPDTPKNIAEAEQIKNQ